jgi:hypothetical protein
MTLFCAICTLAVDYGHVQTVKSEMQRAADATARGYMEMYNVYGQSYANSHYTSLYASAQNPIDAKSGYTPTVTLQFGSWNTGTSTFIASAGTTPAVKITITRTAANGNPVKLAWGNLIGINTIDVHVSAVAALMGGNSASVNVPSTADLYFAGMPTSTTDSWGDNFTNNAPYQVASIPVTPGTYITFSNPSGTSSVVPGSVPYSGAGGSNTYIVAHGQNWDGTMYYPGADNGIADAKMPEDSMTGMFLTDNAPNLTAAPSGQADWTQPSVGDQAMNNNIVVKQPFMIGNGKTSGGVTKQFLVPPGATRFYMGLWDGVDYNNNSGAVSGTITVSNYVQLVQ